MSFGWSAGDIVAAISLVNRIIICVGSIRGSREHFQELESELRGLSRALNEISELARIPDQVPDIVALKFAGCLCGDTLERFYEKIKPFDASLGAMAPKEGKKIKAVPRMVRWELLVKKDIPEFRSYLVAHVGSLNLRLNTAMLKLAAKRMVHSDKKHAEQQRSIEDVRREIISQAQSMCNSITLISTRNTIPKLDSLLSIASSVWKMQNEIMEQLAKAAEGLSSPDLGHTWPQAPIWFEDALGRVIPIPSEYDWDTLEAVVGAQFKNGRPGYKKFQSGEYELFQTNTNILIQPTKYIPRPGMRITMAFIIGQYAGSERCPRSGCTSRSFTQTGTFGWRCDQCDGWFRKSSSELPRPMKPFKEPLHRSSPPRTMLWGDASNLRNTLAFDDRQNFKNLSIYVSQLPVTPSRFREKYVRSSMPVAPSQTPRRPTNAAKSDFLTLQLEALITELHSIILRDLGNQTILNLDHFDPSLKVGKNYEYWNPDWEGMKGLLCFVKHESDRADLSRRMDNLRQSIQRNIEATSFPVRTLGTLPEKGLAAIREKELYIFPRNIPLTMHQENHSQSSQTASTPNLFAPMLSSRSAYTPYIPPQSPMFHSRSTCMPYVPLPPPMFHSPSAHMPYLRPPFTPIPLPRSAQMHYVPPPVTPLPIPRTAFQLVSDVVPHGQYFAENANFGLE